MGNSYWESFFQYSVARLQRDRASFDKFILQDYVVMLSAISEMMIQREEQLIYDVVEFVREHPEATAEELCADYIVSPKEELFEKFLQRDGKVMLNTKEVSEEEFKQILCEEDTEKMQKFVQYFAVEEEKKPTKKVKAVMKTPKSRSKPKSKREQKREAQEVVRKFGDKETQSDANTTPSKKYSEAELEPVMLNGEMYMLMDGEFYDKNVKLVTDAVTIALLNKRRDNCVTSVVATSK